MKRGQVSIFIIIGIVIIVALILFFVFKKDIISSQISSRDINPNIFLETCIENKVKQTAEIIGMQGGYVNPYFSKKFKFSDEENYKNIAYLCYTQNDYVPCVNQEPMLIQHIKKEIENGIKEEVENCYDELILKLKEENYEIDSEYKDFEIDLIPKRIKVKINAEISMKKNEISSKQNDFSVNVNSYLYDLAVIAQEIVNQEAEYCNFEILGFMLLNPEFEIDKFKTSDLDTIYTLKNKKSGEIFRFAVRGCGIPPGF